MRTAGIHVYPVFELISVRKDAWKIEIQSKNLSEFVQLETILIFKQEVYFNCFSV